jgi:hypothetical protein
LLRFESRIFTSLSARKYFVFSSIFHEKDEGLTVGWEEIQDEQGNTKYFWNRNTEETQLEKPEVIMGNVKLRKHSS